MFIIVYDVYVKLKKKKDCCFSCETVSHVVPDEEPAGPVFITFPSSALIDEGTPVTFNCSLDSPSDVTGKQRNVVCCSLGLECTLRWFSNLLMWEVMY